MYSSPQRAPITSLPDTEEAVNAHTLDYIAELVLDVKNHGYALQDSAPMQVNRFLSFAAVRLAEEYYNKIIAGEGYYVNPRDDGANF